MSADVTVTMTNDNNNNKKFDNFMSVPRHFLTRQFLTQTFSQPTFSHRFQRKKFSWGRVPRIGNVMESFMSHNSRRTVVMDTRDSTPTEFFLKKEACTGLSQECVFKRG
jgi:hypothetical protein